LTSLTLLHTLHRSRPIHDFTPLPWSISFIMWSPRTCWATWHWLTTPEHIRCSAFLFVFILVNSARSVERRFAAAGNLLSCRVARIKWNYTLSVPYIDISLYRIVSVIQNSVMGFNNCTRVSKGVAKCVTEIFWGKNNEIRVVYLFLFRGKISILNYNIFLGLYPWTPIKREKGRRYRRGKGKRDERWEVASWLSDSPWIPLKLLKGNYTCELFNIGFGAQ